MSTLKTTNLQNADASSANIVLGQGSGGGATISGVTTSSTLRATTGIVTSLVGGSARFTDDGSASPTVSIQTDDANPYALNIGNQSYSADTSYGLNLYNNNSGEGYFRHVGNSAYLDYHFSLHNNSSNKLCLKFESDDQSVELYAAGSKKFETTETGTVTTGISTATHFVPTAQPYGTKNLVINGSMLVAQRGTSSTTNGYGSLDRWNVTMGNTDEAFTHSQIELSSSDTGPWAEGFHNAMRIQNGNQTSGWQANSHGILHQHIEDRDIAQSGWQIESPSSYITVSYWIRSSVAQAFGGHVETYDGTDKTWMWSTGTLSANTWTKITKTIGGDSALSMSNNNGRGLQIQPWFIWGTDYTASDATLNAWATYNGSKRFTDMTSTWWTTNDATVDITGVQIEVGKAATPFEHISYADQLQRCKRYYNAFGIPGSGTGAGAGYMLLSGGYAKFGGATSLAFNRVFYDVEMRATPTVKYGRNSANDDMVIMRWSDLGSNPTLTLNSSEGANANGFHPTLYNSTAGQTYDEGKWFIHSFTKFRADAEL